MNNEELDSQLSAMFDDELPEPECELLARRLARDEGLKARWGRYAVIAACLRSGPQVAASSAAAPPPGLEGRLPPIRLNGDLAGRVSQALAAEPSLLAGTGMGRSGRRLGHAAMGRVWQSVAGGAVVAAGVAAAAILWLRTGSPDVPVVAQTPTLARAATRAAQLVTRPALVQVATPGGNVASAAASRGAPSSPDSFVVPPSVPSSSFAPPIELANFVVVHSEYSMPLPRRSALSALVADEPPDNDAAENPPASDRSRSGADQQAGNAADAPHADSSR